MEFNKIAIIGVGLIGGSIAMALKERGIRGRITGIGRNRERLKNARDKGIVDEYSTVPSEGVAGADLIILSTPVGRFEGIMEAIKGSIGRGAIVTDVGSVKAGVVERLSSMVPDGVSFVGAHPIAGGESSGFESARPDLFKGALCIITPVTSTEAHAIRVVSELWRAVGADVRYMSPDEHDIVYASVSHLPHVIAYALINAILDRDDILSYGGNGLRDMTRIALSSAELWRDICMYNRENILDAIKGFTSRLSRITEMIEASEWAGLEREFERAREGRRLIEPD
jgi:prephenate dehydrogenase